MLDEILAGLRKIPVYVLTGFLGSGKTTLLRRLIAQGELKDTAILVNEFGDLGIDDLLVRQVNEQTVLLSSGCICCSVRADLLDALRDLFALKLEDDSASFSRVVIETSGATDPIPVIHTLNTDPFLQERFSLEGVIATCDSSSSDADLFHYEEALRQLALADWVVITKQDLVDLPKAQKVEEVIRQVNPDAQVTDTSEPGIGMLSCAIGSGSLAQTASWRSSLFDMTGRVADIRRKSGMPRRALSENRMSAPHVSRLESILLKAEEPLDWFAFNEWVSILLRDKSEVILRLKGIVTFKGQEKKAVIQSVRQVFYPVTWLDADLNSAEQTRMVLIVENPEGISRKELVKRTLPGDEVLEVIAVAT